METQNSLTDTILITTIKIQNEFPELIKYLDEIPEKFSSIDYKGVNNNDLKEYLDSLKKLLKSYAKEH